MPASWWNSDAKIGKGRSSKTRQQKPAKAYVTCLQCGDSWTYVGNYKYCNKCAAPFPDWEEHSQRSQTCKAPKKDEAPILNPLFRTVVEGLVGIWASQSEEDQKACFTIMEVIKQRNKDSKTQEENHSSARVDPADPVMHKAFITKKKALEQVKHELQVKVTQLTRHGQMRLP